MAPQQRRRHGYAASHRQALEFEGKKNRSAAVPRDACLTVILFLIGCAMEEGGGRHALVSSPMNTKWPIMPWW